MKIGIKKTLETVFFGGVFGGCYLVSQIYPSSIKYITIGVVAVILGIVFLVAYVMITDWWERRKWGD